MNFYARLEMPFWGFYLSDLPSIDQSVCSSVYHFISNCIKHNIVSLHRCTLTKFEL